MYAKKRFTLIFIVAVLLTTLFACDEGVNISEADYETEAVMPPSVGKHAAVDAQSNGEILFGPERFVRSRGRPVTETRQVADEDFEHFTGPFVLYARNGDENGRKRVSSGIVKVDGVTLLGPSDFRGRGDNDDDGDDDDDGFAAAKSAGNDGDDDDGGRNRPTVLSAEVSLTEASVLTVKLRGRPGSFVEIWIEGMLRPGRARIGPEGGMVTAGDGDVELMIPNGALSEELIITIQPGGAVPPGAGLLESSVWDFGPEGTLFDPPAHLTLAYTPPAGVPEEALTLLTEAGNFWEEIEASVVNEDLNTVTGFIGGFSQKAVGMEADTVEVIPLDTSLQVGESLQLTATVRDTLGNALTNRPVDWASSNENILTVDQDGLVTAIAEGTAFIITTSGNASGVAHVTVGLSEVVWTQVVAGTFHTCGLASDGSAYCWGRNRGGQLGDGTGGEVGDQSQVPVQVANGHVFTSLIAGANHTCGVTTEGDGYCWGSNWAGQVGNGGRSNGEIEPRQVAGSVLINSSPIVA